MEWEFYTILSHTIIKTRLLILSLSSSLLLLLSVYIVEGKKRFLLFSSKHLIIAFRYMADTTFYIIFIAYSDTFSIAHRHRKINMPLENSD